MFFKDKELTERTEKLAYEIDELKSQIKATDLSGIRKDHTELFEKQFQNQNEVKLIRESQFEQQKKLRYLEEKLNHLESFFSKLSKAFGHDFSESTQQTTIETLKQKPNKYIHISNALKGKPWSPARRESFLNRKGHSQKAKGWDTKKASHSSHGWPEFYKENPDLFLRTTEIELSYAPISQYFLHKHDHLIPMYICPRNGWRMFYKKDIEEIHQAIKDGTVEETLKKIVARPRIYQRKYII